MVRLLCLALVAAARWLPVGTLPFRCLFHELTGYPCASCGMTRAWVHMAHGEVPQALALSPLGALLFVGALVAVARGVPRVPVGAWVALAACNWAYVVWHA